LSQLTRNILTLYAARAVSIVAGIALFPFIAAQVGLEAFGVWLLISSITIFFSTTDFGLGTSAIRYIAAAHGDDDHDQVNRVLCSTLACFLVLGAALAAVYVGVFAVLWDHFDIPSGQQTAAREILVIVAATTLLIGMPLYVFRQVLAAIGHYDKANAILLGQTLLRVTLIVGLLLGGLGIVSVALAEGIAAIVSSTAALIWCRRLLPRLRLHPSLASMRLVREMAPYSAQVFVMGMAALVILETDTIVIGLSLPILMVTLYSGAFRIYKTARDVTQSIMQAVVPDASRALARGELDRVRMLLLRGSTFANLLVAAVAVPIMVFARPLLVTWAGAQFDQVVGVLLILMGGLLLNNNHLVAVGVLTGMGRIGAYTRLHVIWALANVALSLALIGPLGLEGVALGSVLPLVVLEPIYLRIALRETGVSPRAFVLTAIVRPYGCAAVAAIAPLALLAAMGPTIAAAVVGTAAYLVLYGALTLSRGLHREQRTVLRRMIPTPGM
jgi:O-antigen/teichoic acid export membrane protein